MTGARVYRKLDCRCIGKHSNLFALRLMNFHIEIISPDILLISVNRHCPLLVAGELNFRAYVLSRRGSHLDSYLRGTFHVTFKLSLWFQFMVTLVWYDAPWFINIQSNLYWTLSCSRSIEKIFCQNRLIKRLFMILLFFSLQLVFRAKQLF